MYIFQSQVALITVAHFYMVSQGKILKFQCIMNPI